MKKIVIEPKNPLDVKPEDVQTLAEEIRALYRNYNVTVEGEGYSGYAVTFYEVVNVWILAPVSGALILEITKLSIKWARQRFSQKGKENRPKSITIYGPKGDPIKHITLKNAVDEPEIQTPKRDERYRIKPPYEYKPTLFPLNLWSKLFKKK